MMLHNTISILGQYYSKQYVNDAFHIHGAAYFYFCNQHVSIMLEKISLSWMLPYMT